MTRILRCALTTMLTLTLVAGATPASFASDRSDLATDAAARARTRSALDALPLFFTENRGQVDAPVAYYVQGRHATVYFAPDGITFALVSERAAPAVQRTALATAPSAARERWTIKLSFVGVNPGTGPLGEEPTAAHISHFSGRPEQWRTGLRTYGALRYRDLWPGIDMVYTGSGDRLKYTFVVRPGADPQRIRLAYHGPTDVSVTDVGRMQVRTPLGGFTDDAPISHQDIDGTRVVVPTAYRLEGRQGDTWTYGFSVGAYDRSRTLVLDPAVLAYAGYIGGAGFDSATAIAVDPSGSAYVTGFTSSPTPFPASVGPDRTFAGVNDAFVAKVRADGSGLVYAGYIGGDGDDQGDAIAVDAQGNAYVTGGTTSSQATFPVRVGPGTTYRGSGDAFVAKVSADGRSLLYAGYIGGSGRDLGTGIAVDAQGNAYVTGYTDSIDFPARVGPAISFIGGDAFVAKITPDGSSTVYAGFLGSVETTISTAIAVDAAGRAYVAGYTNAPYDRFPSNVGPGLVPGGGSYDAFVAKVSADGRGLAYAGYLGGSGLDFATGIAVDADGYAYVTGYTESADFPTAGGLPRTYRGQGDAFVTKIKRDGSGLVYSGYLGGTGTDHGQAVAVDIDGSAYVTGSTTSTQSSFPVAVGPDLSHGGGNDAFVTKVAADGSGFVFSGFVGGAGNDYGLGIAVDGDGNAYIAGQTESPPSSFPVTVGPGLIYSGGTDAFVAKIVAPTCAGTGVCIARFSPARGVAGTSIVLTGTSFTGATSVKFNGTAAAFTLNSATQITATVPAGATSGPLTVTAAGGSATSGTSFTVLVPPTVTSLAPATGTPGTSVVITGTNLTDATSVTFGTTMASFTVTSATRMTASVPSGAVTGPVTVTAPGGTAGSAASFTVLGPPRITSFTPATAAPGAPVVITGTNLGSVIVVIFNGIEAAFTVDSPTQVTTTVPAGDTAGPIVISTAAYFAMSPVDFVPITTPSITSFAPANGAAGTKITLTGVNFTGATSVKFNGVAALFTVVSPVQLTATVPATAATGAITVTTPRGIATSATAFGVAPRLTGFTPSAAAAGATVTLTGSSFTGATGVFMNGARATFTVLSPTKIAATVPPDATRGKITVTSPTGTATSAGTFSVKPVIQSMTPPSGKPGDVVTFTGSGFAGTTAVRIHGVSAAFTVQSPNQITATVPPTATTGTVSVTNVAGTATGPTFQVAPLVTTFSPSSGAAGLTVYVTGKSFSGATAVGFGGVPATFTVSSATRIVATVPAGALTGAISVATPAGSASSTLAFLAE